MPRVSNLMDHMRARRAGVPFEQMVQDKFESETEMLDSKIAEMAQVLRQREGKIEDVMRQSMDDLDESSPFKAAKESLIQLQNEAIGLKSKQKELLAALVSKREELIHEIATKAGILKTLEELRRIPPPKNTIVPHLEQVGARVSHFIVQHKG